ncbi:alpha/beta hydrolase [Comamonas terrigena]|uniref:Alpha/beta hydrolase n=1 Tax=Comamonas terrigena TaxID=32013 RepID=A0A2A7UQ19_COMTR|nr:alpha/beta hydrolase [Comamonas terrigena]PEH87296.1 alpha/beta hydrolase [Comamonas terrigena]BBL26250.1 hypothetical protein CT3_37050 [Comamonas terrigena NBRC 13299]SUY70179.1 acetoin dehydrogenase E2 subunit dihydrolipoyllysine-residue acetyltransferase [Comamonas terrigena]
MNARGAQGADEAPDVLAADAATAACSEAFAGYRLPGQLRPAGAAADCPLLALHGARSNLQRLNGLLAPLQQLGVGSLAPSLSGHGPDSPMPVEQTSLAHNLQEALRFAARLGPQLRMVYGSSMGGALAMRVAEHHADQIQVLALCGPALYPEAAWSAPHFGAPFREAISTPFGFLQSRSLDFVRRFAGRLLLIQGEWDGLQATAHGAPAGRAAGETTLQRPDGSHHTVWSPIPAEVFSALADAAGARLQHIVLEGADHRVAAHLQQHPAVARTLAGLMQQALHAPQPDQGPRRLRIDLRGQLRPA